MNGDPPAELLPARMVAEFVYCPRLMYLEWVGKEWDDSPDTVQGRMQHQNVDRPQREPPAHDVDPDVPRTIRSLSLSDATLGLSARIDLAELSGDEAVPVERKVGRPGRDGPWEADLIQVTIQAMLLRADGRRCEHGVLYYGATRQRFDVPITSELVSRALAARDGMQAAAAQPSPPPPLVDSPKCPRCSMVGICLPDETTLLQERPTTAPPPSAVRERIRRLIPARTDRVPLYLLRQGSVLRKNGERLRITLERETLDEVRLADISQVSVFGNIEVSTPALAALFSESIPVLYFSHGGWFRGMSGAAAAQNAPMRLAQYRACLDESLCIDATRRIVSAKVHNARLLIRRNSPGDAALAPLQIAARTALRSKATETLLGLEGNAGRTYFEAFGRLAQEYGSEFAWSERNRRPPRDPINALLSYLYALLLKDAIAAIYAVGLDPYVGLYHRPGYGKPALALDIMEPYRPLVADSTAVGLLGRRMLTARDFVRASTGVSLTQEGRRTTVGAYEQRLDTLFEHPLFGYQVSYRRSLEIEARMLGRLVQGEIDHLHPLRGR